jgi:hypothetical protein
MRKPFLFLIFFFSLTIAAVQASAASRCSAVLMSQNKAFTNEDFDRIQREVKDRASNREALIDYLINQFKSPYFSRENLPRIMVTLALANKATSISGVKLLDAVREKVVTDETDNKSLAGVYRNITSLLFTQGTEVENGPKFADLSRLTQNRKSLVTEAFFLTPTLTTYYSKDLRSFYLKSLGINKNNVDQIARPFAENLSHSLVAVYSGLSAPKAFQFAKQLIRKSLSLPYIPLTDVMFTRAYNTYVQAQIISVDAFILNGQKNEIAPQADLAFAADTKTFGVLGLDNSDQAQMKVQWTVGGKTFFAEAKITKGKLADKILPKVTKFDRSEMLKNGRQTGLILVGNNLGDFAPELIGQYKEYFEQNGFKFAKQQNIPDIKTFMKKAVSEGELDYVVKEAHALGDDSVLVKLTLDGAILTGTKALADGKQEVIYLFLPEKTKQDSFQSERLEYKEFAEWINNRAKKQDPSSLIYLDTSCHGISCIQKFTTLAQNPLLIGVGANRLVETFVNEANDPVGLLMDGIRNGKSFQEIRSNQAIQDAGYLFPDQAEWRSVFEQAVPLIIETRVLDKNGRLVTVETMRAEAERQGVLQ